jgi:uncharacterized paraquat-inducible protein A
MSQCPHCKEDVHAQATRCPHCAGEIKMSNRDAFYVVLAIVLLLVATAPCWWTLLITGR